MTTWRRLGPADTAGLVSLEEMRAHVRVDHTEEDALIGAYLGSAIEHAEAVCRRPLLPGAYEAEAVMPRQTVPLPCPPGAVLVTVERVEYDGAGGVVELDPASFLVQPGDEPELRPAPGTYWPADAWGRAVRVRYAVAYPEDVRAADSVKVAVLLLAAHWYATRESVVIGSIASAVPQGADMLLWPHRRLSFA